MQQKRPVLNLLFSAPNYLRLWHAKTRRHLKHRRLVLESGLFDAEWYIQKYPDVRDFSGDPLDHFLKHGGPDERSPSVAFDAKSYLLNNPDVVESGLNPLVHFILHGAPEGRQKLTLLEAPLYARSKARAEKLADVTFSLLIRSGPAKQVDKTLESVRRQLDAHYEIISLSNDAQFRSQLLSFSKLFNRPGSNIQVDAAGADAEYDLTSILQRAQNEFVIFLDAGDSLKPNALMLLSHQIRQLECDVIYSDERSIENDNVDASSVLKPAWSPALLAAYNYFGRITAIRRELAVKCSDGLTSEPSAEWALNLRLGTCTPAIERLPVVLCERGSSLNFDRNRALGNERHKYETILKGYWKERGFDARVLVQRDGTLQARWDLVRKPLVSIIVPTKDRAALLRTLAVGLYNATTYENFELIIVDNGSIEHATEELYEELRAKSARIVNFDEEFNYSRACNLGASLARGELLLFANNDLEVIRPDWLDELVRQISLPGVGIVGPKLLYPSGEIQHAGVAIGMFTLAAHIFSGAQADEWGPLGSADVQRNYMAVTGACMLVRRNVFDLVHGFDERFLLAYSDIVLCLNAYRLGFKIVYAASSALVHHEGKSRGKWTPRNDQVLFAVVLRALGIAEDPYFHPALDSLSFIPKIDASAAGLVENRRLAEDIERLASEAKSSNIIDVHDDGRVADAGGIAWKWVTYPFDLQWLNPNIVSAAQIVIEMIRRRRDIRLRFPRALSDGGRGGFAEWVKKEGLKLLGLSEEYSRWIEAAYDARLGDRARQFLAYDDEARVEQPLLLLPNGRSAACPRLFKAVQDGRLQLEAVWWYLVESSEHPKADLFWTWAITPAWQTAVPDGGTVFGAKRLVEWVSESYGITDEWLFSQPDPQLMSAADQLRLAYGVRSDWRDKFPRAMSDPVETRALIDYLRTRESGVPIRVRKWLSEWDRSDVVTKTARRGVNILGHFAYPSGLRISTESIVESLRLNDYDLSLRNVPVSDETDEPIGHQFIGCELYDTTIIHVQPEPFFSSAYERSGLRPRPELTYRIGYWYWESGIIPSSWDRAAFDCDELWAATEFVAEGLRERYKQPVHVFFPGLEIAPFEHLPKDYFSLEPSKFTFLFIFHMTSIMERKNPFALIKAFRQAFRDSDDAALVIKTTFGSRHPEQLARLQEAAAEANIRVIDQTFSRDETLSLIANCDAYISLHRSEGLGLTIAEAMLLGRPAIATNYSGNLSFMDNENSLLVDCKLVMLNAEFPPYEIGQQWAQPSLEHAAAQMRRLYDDRAFAAELGEKGKADLQRRLNFRTSGGAMAARLDNIGAFIA